ncbi:MAG: hypothetical protein K5637_07790 [Lachnospiraceae bacterium]|nr:hypothetical protein [Lachnospiraceae bacterium]
MFRKKIGKAACAAAVMAFVMAAGAPAAFAAEQYDPVQGGEITIEKYLVMDEGTVTPAVTFSFSIEAGTALSSDETDGTDDEASLEIFSGGDTSRVTGTPTIGQAVFAANQEQYSEALPSENSAIQNDDDGDGTVNTDGVVLGDGKVYSRSPITIDFSGVTFNEPGVYRYVVTELETAADANGQQMQGGIAFDDDLTRTLDVYVEDDGAGTLAVVGYVLHNSDGAALDYDGANIDESGYKADGFQNAYSSKDLLVGKHVTGNQASRDEYFEITVTLTGSVPGSCCFVNLDHADLLTGVNGASTEAHDNTADLEAVYTYIPSGSTVPVKYEGTVGGTEADPTGTVDGETVALTKAYQIVFDSSGSATAVFWLKGGSDQYIVIEGLPYGTDYTVSENASTMKSEGYTDTIDNADDSKTTDEASFTTSGCIGDEDIADTQNNDEYDSSRAQLSDASNRVDVDIVNKRSGVIPTGIFVSCGAGLAALAAGGAGIVFMKTKKRAKA